MNIGTHQYPQLQPLLFHLPEGAGGAQAVPQPRGQGTEVSEGKYAEEDLSVPFTCLGVELSNASSLESWRADSLASALVAHFTSTPRHCSNTDALGLAGMLPGTKKCVQGLLVFLYSHGYSAMVRVLAGACRDGGCSWCFQVSMDRTCWSTVICSPLWQVVLCSGIIFQKTSSANRCMERRSSGVSRRSFFYRGNFRQTDNGIEIPLGVSCHP